MEKLTENSVWQELTAHYQKTKKLEIKELFENDSQRFNKFSIQHENLLVDFSKNRANEQTIALLLELAKSRNVHKAINDLFLGEKINLTEKRSVLHTALRNFSHEPISVNGKDVMPEVFKEREQVRRLSEKIRNQQWKGFTGKTINCLVNIGIGGSYLGPRMVTEALKDYENTTIQIEFIANIDGADLRQALKNTDPETTLFIVSSKSFNTPETLINASIIRNLLMTRFQDEKAIASHFIAITANPEKAMEFGIPYQNILKLWDWVGGRFSIWSSMGFVLAVQIGYARFEEFLEGANDMDEHFRNTPLNKNIPVILALLGIWYNNFFNAQTYALLPYSQHLRLLPAYFQQVDMESNGKSVSKSNEIIDYSTGPVIWGQQGTNGQHAFFQHLHQGTKMIPFDLIGFVNSMEEYEHHDEQHEFLFANLLAQSKAFVEGKNSTQLLDELLSKGFSTEEAKGLLLHKSLQGNHPHNVILFDQLNPRNLGMVMAMYEHKIFIQGIIWDINSFDQFGVELGKELADDLMPYLKNERENDNLDNSTKGLINFYRNQRFSIKANL
ncbi:MAG: glucose-6-phosphate isomerase [Bacteroidetes bacterium]|nr:glucose-6-phosphate isomerase [Bacteroidota bacterium]HET6243730.1 glucose-6-phosphate isomerase [Bacteroidia bacterium]